MKLLKKDAAAIEVIAHDVSPLTVDTDSRPYTRLGWLVTLVGVGGFVLWASIAPLDKGVPLTGVVAKDSSRKAIQHLGGGTIEDILVREGDQVKAGQVLVRMNTVQANSAAEMTRAQLYAAQASEARMLAERDGRDAVQFPKELLARKKSDPHLAANMDNQVLLFASRRMALHTEIGAIEDGIAGLQSQSVGMQASRDSKKVQIAILKEQTDNVRELAKEGYVPRSRLLELERVLAQTNGALAEEIGNLGRIERQIAELTRRRALRTQDFKKEVGTQLAEVQSQAESLASKLTLHEYELANTEVKAPVDGIVMGVNIATRGGVINSGFRMMDLVPLNDALVVEGKLPVHLVDKVQRDLPVNLIFSAFNTNVTPQIEGKVSQVGADRLVEEQSGMPYYKVKVVVAPEGAKKIAALKLNIQPGMPVDLFVKTGERSMMSYLFKPLLDRAKTALSEE